MEITGLLAARYFPRLNHFAGPSLHSHTQASPELDERFNYIKTQGRLKVFVGWAFSRCDKVLDDVRGETLF